MMIYLPQEILFPEADKLSRIEVERSRISAWYLRPIPRVTRAGNPGFEHLDHATQAHLTQRPRTGSHVAVFRRPFVGSALRLPGLKLKTSAASAAERSEAAEAACPAPGTPLPSLPPRKNP